MERRRRRAAELRSQGLTYEAIAAELGCAVGTVRRDLVRAGIVTSGLPERHQPLAAFMSERKRISREARIRPPRLSNLAEGRAYPTRRELSALSDATGRWPPCLFEDAVLPDGVEACAEHAGGTNTAIHLDPTRDLGTRHRGAVRQVRTPPAVSAPR